MPSYSPGLDERDAVVRVGHVGRVDLAAGLLLERGDPVVGRVDVAALGVARPDDEVELALAVAERRLRARRGRPAAAATRGHDERRDPGERQKPPILHAWSLLLHLAPVCDGELMLSLPDQADSLAFLGERLGRGRREVLLGDDELATRHRARRCSACPGRGRRRPDPAARPNARPPRPRCRARPGRIFSGRTVNDPVLADHLPGRIAGEQVRGPDEAGDEAASSGRS